MSWYPTQSSYPATELTNLFLIILMPSIRPGRDKYQFLSNSFVLTENWTSDRPYARLTLCRFGHQAQSLSYRGFLMQSFFQRLPLQVAFHLGRWVHLTTIMSFLWLSNSGSFTHCRLSLFCMLLWQNAKFSQFNSKYHIVCLAVKWKDTYININLTHVH